MECFLKIPPKSPSSSKATTSLLKIAAKDWWWYVKSEIHIFGGWIITFDAWIYLQAFWCNPHVGCLWIGMFFDCNFVVSLSPCTTYLRNLRLCWLFKSPCWLVNSTPFSLDGGIIMCHNICISTDHNDHVTICCLNPQISPLLGQTQIPVIPNVKHFRLVGSTKIIISVM